MPKRCERSILNVKRKDRLRNAGIRETTNIIDVLKHCAIKRGPESDQIRDGQMRQTKQLAKTG